MVTIKDFLEEQKELFNQLHNKCGKKQVEYTRGLSAFHNFEKAKGLSFHCSESKVAWEYCVKHLQSIKDLLSDDESGKPIDIEVIDEKFGDVIIYMTLIRSMLIDKNKGIELK